MTARYHKLFYWLAASLLILDVFIWSIIVISHNRKSLALYFLDVGQGDSELIITDGVKILIDGGPVNGKLLGELGHILSPHDRYIDLVMMTHPQLDHYGGLIELLKNYRVGAFVSNGRKGDNEFYRELIKTIQTQSIPYIILGEGDRIKYQTAKLTILNPSPKNLVSYELNDTSLVTLLEKSGLRALYTGDAGANIEKELVAKYQLSAHILKVGHHGSKYASGREFLKAVKPQIAVIEVGKNSYGHPTSETLARLAAIGSKIFRTDLDKTLKLVWDNSVIAVYK